MKALIRKQGINGYVWEQDTIMLEPFPKGTDDIGRPYTLEGYRYALCTDAPENPVPDANGNDARLDAANYDVTEHQETVEQDGEQITRTYWTATYTGGNQ